MSFILLRYFVALIFHKSAAVNVADVNMEHKGVIHRSHDLCVNVEIMLLKDQIQRYIEHEQELESKAMDHVSIRIRINCHCQSLIVDLRNTVYRWKQKNI
jgi:hypothetical protein